MAALIREPIGLRVLLRAVRPEDDAPLLLWRADVQPELDALLERGEAEEPAALWAALLRWREAEAVMADLQAQNWRVTLHGVRAIALARAVALLRPPGAADGWTFEVAGLRLLAVPEQPGDDDEELRRLLAFLDET